MPCDPILDAFLSGCGRSNSPSEAESQELVPAIERLHGLGVKTWPRVKLGIEQFARYLGDVANADATDLLDTKLHASDLYLACGCYYGIAEAIDTFESVYLSGIDRFVRIVQPERGFIDDVRQDLRQRLFVSEPPGIAQISRYSGRGSLGSWIGVVAQRAALTLLRRIKADRSAGAPLDDAVEAIAAHDDPELSYLRKRYRVAFQDTFRAGLAALSERDRLILKLNIVNGVSLERIAAMYDVSQSTISRWAATARASHSRRSSPPDCGAAGRLR